MLLSITSTRILIIYIRLNKMKTEKQIEKRIAELKEQLYSQSFERKDTSYKSGRYFGTHAADVSDCLVIGVAARTPYLNTYICVKDTPENIALNAEYSHLRDKLDALRLKKANSNLSAKIRDVIKFGKWDAVKNPNGQYFSAGVYRAAFDRYGNVIASVKGGFHDSCPYLTDSKKWVSKLEKTLNSLPDVHVVLKCDGSCGELFLRDYYEFENKKPKVYVVPNMQRGGVHVNMQIL